MKLTQLFPEVLHEVHYTDIYPASFEDFRKRYLKLLRTERYRATTLYVQFTSNGSGMDRTAWQTPDHADPVGVYAYPLAYVLSHPSDIWYGKGARYLRVLESTAKNSLIINQVETQNQVERLLAKMGFDWDAIDTMLAACKKNYKFRIEGPNKVAKLFLQALQTDIAGGPTKVPTASDYKKTLEFRIRSGAEQTALLRKAGFDAMEDRSANNRQAVINDREPQQIIFLSRAAFKIVEVVDLRSGVSPSRLPGQTHSSPDTPLVERKLVAAIAGLMDDRIKDGPERSSLNGWSYYWTHKGRRIEIEFTLPSSYYDKKMGEKKHKTNKLSDEYEPHIVIQTEKGRVEANFTSSAKFSEIQQELRSDLIRLGKNPEQTEWTPEDRAGYMQKQEDKRRAFFQKKQDAAAAAKLAELPKFLSDIRFVGKHYDLPFAPNADYNSNVNLMDLCEVYSGIAAKNSVGQADSFVRDHEISGAPVMEALLPQWEQISAILAKAYPDLKDHESSWWFTRRNSTMFDGMRKILVGWRPGQPEPSDD